eukprot:m.32758 g.32758  ORF g.32758 m.32758 type:complete len:308 (-) comp14160_c0_seq1:404-1327(-)
MVEKALHIDVVSDTICPWCYLGKRRLETALRELKLIYTDVNFTLRWRPHFVAPHLPRLGVDKKKSYMKKLGSSKRISAMMTYMQSLGERETPPIMFKFGGKIANSMDSHRLLDWAFEHYGSGFQTALVEELSKKYFEEEASLGEHTVMLDAISKAAGTLMYQAKCGNDGSSAYQRSIVHGAREMLSSASDAAIRGARVVAEAMFFSQEYMLSGVPAYVVNGIQIIPGAQDPATFVRVLGKAIQQMPHRQPQNLPRALPAAQIRCHRRAALDTWQTAVTKECADCCDRDGKENAGNCDLKKSVTLSRL